MNPHSRVPLRVFAAAAMAVAGALWYAVPSQAHKTVTSKYRFNEDVFPLFREKCGRCHVDGGVAPMSLMTFDDAAPWAESLRIELTAEETPAHHPMTLSARELDLILVWATGGAPRGQLEHAPPPVVLENTWVSGAPHAILPMPAAFTLPGAANEATHETVLPLGSVSGKRVAAVDLLPGTPAIVRSATLLLKSGSSAPKEVATWMPGGATSVPLATPVAVPDGSSLIVRIHYQRTWKYEGKDMTDKSAVGLYFDDPSSRVTGGKPPAAK